MVLVLTILVTMSKFWTALQATNIWRSSARTRFPTWIPGDGVLGLSVLGPLPPSLLVSYALALTLQHHSSLHSPSSLSSFNLLPPPHHISPWSPHWSGNPVGRKGRAGWQSPRSFWWSSPLGPESSFYQNHHQRNHDHHYHYHHLFPA